MRSTRTRAALVAVGATMAFAAGCGGDDSSSDSPKAADGPVTLTWWHNGNTDPLKTVWADAAASFQKANPDVTLKLEPTQNEQLRTKIPLALQGDNPPDVFQQWGGGEQAGQVRSGKLMDITGPAESWIGELGNTVDGWQTDGRQFGVPYQLHVVGFWYRKDLFERAGIDAPPATMDELNAAVEKLKAADIAPISVGSKDKWPDAFYWANFALRECATEVLQKAVADVSLADPCFTKAGEDLRAFLDTKPFQPGFLGTPAQQGAGSSAGLLANGKAAMELQGTWQPGVMAALTSDKKLNAKLGWFPFPSVEGGQGDLGVALGGGDGFSCTTEATEACVKFLQHLTSPEVQTELISSGAASLPVNPAAASAVKDPTVKQVLEYSQSASYIQTYFDVALPTAPGQALNEAVANMFAGQGGPEDVVAAVGP